jgi:hypothetical protein
MLKGSCSTKNFETVNQSLKIPAEFSEEGQKLLVMVGSEFSITSRPCHTRIILIDFGCSFSRPIGGMLDGTRFETVRLPLKNYTEASIC